MQLYLSTSYVGAPEHHVVVVVATFYVKQIYIDPRPIELLYAHSDLQNC